MTAIVFAWLSSDAPIAKGYGNIMVMQSFIPAVRNARKQYGLRVLGIMAKITRESGASKGSSSNTESLAENEK